MRWADCDGPIAAERPNLNIVLDVVIVRFLFLESTTVMARRLMMQRLFSIGSLVAVSLFGCQATGAGEMMADREAVAMANERIADAVAENAIDSPGEVVVVYFTPRDRQPAQDHVTRLRRIVEETASFYTHELDRHGLADRKLNVRRDDQGRVMVIDVVGANDDRNYGKPDGRKIRDEVVPVLRAQNINPDASVILLFCNLMDYDPVTSKISHHSPYYGGGTHLAGTAWQCDSPILDPLRLTDSTPLLDGQYGRITIGRHNSIFIGGVIHELGHALSLPHCRQRQDEASRGTALMGSGNRTYGEQLRGEGLGTFLTQAHALRLAAHPVFNRRVTAQLYDRPQTTWDNLVIDVADRQAVRIVGQLHSDVAIHGLVAYFDPAGGGDYDATTATAVPDAQGRFSMHSEPLKRDSLAELRLVVCHVNGATTTRSFAFRVDQQGTPDLMAVRVELELAPMLDALRSRGVQAAEARLRELSDADPALAQIGQRILSRFRDAGETDTASIDLSDVPLTSMALSRVKPTSAKVGWIRPAYNRVPGEEKLLSVGGDYFASGIYAHAPAEHTYRLGGKWRRLTGKCGIQGTNAGTVVFKIFGDEKLLWESPKVSAGNAIDYDVDLTSIDGLKLVVTDAGDGNGGDWGVWIEPTLARPAKP